MGSLLEEMHKMRLKEKIDELESMGGNPHVADHGLGGDRKSTRLNSSHIEESRMPSSA